MSDPIALVIGNRNYSSWLLRAWLAMKHSVLAFEKIFIPLDLPDTKAAIAKHSPSGLVPVLKVGDNIVWESMVIIETLAELAPDVKFWPEDFAARAMARSVSTQMHAGFFRLRLDMPMDLRNNLSGQNHTEGALGDEAKITTLWTACLERLGGRGPYLFGDWSAADMMYAPVVGRFRTFGVLTNDICESYMDAVLAHPDMAAWMDGAKAEPYIIGNP